MTEPLTDLGRQLAEVREEALRRLLVAEGPSSRMFREEFTTDALVERVEGHADFLVDGDVFGAACSVHGLGRWRMPRLRCLVGHRAKTPNSAYVSS